MAARAPTRSEPVAAALSQASELARLVRRRFPSLDAHEIVQRAALRAIERAEELRDASRARAWVRRVVMSCAYDALRAREVEISDDALEDIPADAPAEGPTCTCSVALMKSLPAPYAEMLRRVDLEGASLDETARALAIEKGNAAVRLHRARAAPCGTSSPSTAGSSPRASV